MKIIYNGDAHEVSPWSWAELREDGIANLSVMRTLVSEGTILNDAGDPIPEGPTLDRVRARLLGTYESMPEPGHVGDPERSFDGADDGPEWLITGLWPWGTIPMLGGQPKAGKTTLVTELVASLVVPGRRFLGRFARADLAEDLETRGVWLINAETPRRALETALWRAGVDDRPVGNYDSPRSRVTVDHLERLGGAQSFDLTDPAVYDIWANRLVGCNDCDGSDDWSPLVVILDGLTAVLHSAGKGVEHYGLWYAAFRRLMRELDVPNALVVAHNTMTGDHLMGAVEAQAGADGLWNYSASRPDDPTSARRFSVVPRLGGVAVPTTGVSRTAEGRLILAGSATPAQPVQAPAGGEARAEASGDPRADSRAALVEYVTECNAAGHGPSVRDIRDRVPGRHEHLDAARRDLLAEGRLVERSRSGRGGGLAYWLRPESDSAAEIGEVEIGEVVVS